MKNVTRGVREGIATILVFVLAFAFYLACNANMR